MDERRFRNHPSVILKNVLAFGFVIVVLGLGFVGSDGGSAAILAILAILVLLCLYMIHWWYRTTYTFTDTELLIDVDTLFKRQDHIPYAKLASVGVTRTLFNHLFGTSTLTFNVNSSMNANVAEGTLCLRRDLADSLRDELNAMIFQKEMSVTEDTAMESMVRVSNCDIIVHSLLGQSTAQLLFAMAMLAYSVFSLVAESAGGFLMSFLMFLLSEIIPVVQVILKYYNYRIYRVGDTITVQSGMVSNYRSSFKINKVNTIRYSQPLLARLAGRAMLVGEIVGLAGEDGVPLLCPMKPEAEVRELMDRLIPEFHCDGEAVGQPVAAFAPMLLANSILAVAVALACVVLYGYVDSMYTFGGSVDTVVAVILLGTPLFVAVLLFGHVFLAQSHRELAIGDGTCLVLHGSYDLKEEYINYDKVQTAEVVSTPIQRLFGLARCSVSLMSSMGSMTVKSGLFRPEDLERIGERVMSRIADGSYDYRDYY